MRTEQSFQVGYAASSHQEVVADALGLIQYSLAAAIAGAVGWFLWRRRSRIREAITGEATSEMTD